MTARSPWAVAVCASVVLHLALGSGLVYGGKLRAVKEAPRRVVVPVDVVIPPPPPPAPKPEPPPEVPREPEAVDEPKPKPKPKPRARKPKPRARPEVTPPKPAERPPPNPTDPPPLMGLPMEGTVTAPTGVAIATPVGRRDGRREGTLGGRGTRPGPAPVRATAAGVSRMPVKRACPKPEFPAELKRAGVEGRVVVSVDVTPDGRTADPKLVTRLHPDLDRNAIRAALRCRFDPALVDGEPVLIRIPIPFRFVID